MPENRSPNDPGNLTDKNVTTPSPRPRKGNFDGSTKEWETYSRNSAGGFPRDQYKDQSGVNAGARGQGNRRLNTAGALPGSSIGCGSENRSSYAQAQITETPGGHIVEYNDTLGSERILIRHVSGSGIEFRPDGSCVISSTRLIFDTQGDVNHLMTGNMNFKVPGVFSMKSGADLNIEAGGNIELLTGGSLVEKVATTKLTHVGGNTRHITLGESQTVTVGPKSDTNLGGTQLSTKGDLTIRTEGRAGIYTSGAMGITSQINAYLSAPKMAVNGDQLEIVGNRGTIGGQNIITYCFNGYAGHTFKSGDTVSTRTLRSSDTVVSPYADITDIKSTHMSATTFNGDLDGIAKEALVAPNGVVTGGTFQSVNETAHVADNTDATFEPNEEIMAARMKTLGHGVKFVKVDPAGYIKDSLNRANHNGLLVAP